VDGKPAEGVSVFLHPVGGSDEFRRERPYGQTDKDGRFRLKTFARDDGAPAGLYRVTFTWFSRGEPRADAAADPERRGPRSIEDKLAGRYADVNETPFDIEIKPGPTQLEPFALTGHQP
jgi:hypothetical protein